MHWLTLDGELMIWNGSNRRLESVIVHKNCISSLTFNADGTRLLSADHVMNHVEFSFDFIILMFLHLGWSNYCLESRFIDSSLTTKCSFTSQCTWRIDHLCHQQISTVRSI